MMNTSCLSSLRDFKEVSVSPRHPLCSVHGADPWGGARGGELLALGAVGCKLLRPVINPATGF